MKREGTLPAKVLRDGAGRFCAGPYGIAGIKKPVTVDRFFVVSRQEATWRKTEISGAGEGNRTLVISLGSWSNAIIRHPLGTADFVPDVATDLKFFFAGSAFT